MLRWPMFFKRSIYREDNPKGFQLRGHSEARLERFCSPLYELQGSCNQHRFW